ncbi:MAG: ABC transporter ATP-binding protein [Actinobacteria bacterium 13_1_20CM_2_65_11]|nr:MAG: ABC transporter ATP-binding protein [Chloroflexi bacterium 13_1_40CM_65_17]OLC65219.1 MAG: ABC transporter ATP-binding protein [Actinobacteria bacterium 13_1_40CM_4_65_12]OLD23888.1 MAG: ABC transporter ATP-binding protein [Chloroflexi bacterium 13_1_40CM_3_65_12]OLE79292.1 MAG: ABC transporter ATP-binding protein [Actinobacteria bacterium 13_1_20CM_2_65_11]
MHAAIEFNAVTKSYGGPASRPVLDDLSLQIGEGEFTAIMGPSGSGKSTLLNLVAGLDRPTSGTVTVGGTALASLSEAELARFRRASIGFVFQFFHLLNNLSVFDNVLIAAQLSGAQEAASRVRAQQLLNELGIGAKARDYPVKLSGGERQRVAIARALINRPAVVLADEPTGALDSNTGEQVMELLVALNQRGQTILLASHDLQLAGRYTRRIISLRDGKLTRDSRTDGQGQEVTQ